MTTTNLGRVTRETGAPPTAVTRWPVYASRAAFVAAVAAAAAGGPVAITDIIEQLSATDTSGLVGDDQQASPTRWPTYDYKSDVLLALFDAVGGGPPALMDIYHRTLNSVMADWTDKGSFAN